MPLPSLRKGSKTSSQQWITEGKSKLMKTPVVVEYWKAFRTASGIDHDQFDVAAFGDDPKMMDELASLVLEGSKRATAPLLRDFVSKGLPPPKAGDFVVVVDGTGSPCCVYETTSAEVRPLNEIDEAFAFDEGEGDKSLDYWKSVHYPYYKRQSESEGFALTDAIEIVLERFRVVWPEEAAYGFKAKR